MDLGLCSVVVFAFGFFEFVGDGLLGLCLYSCWSLGLVDEKVLLLGLCVCVFVFG